MSKGTTTTSDALALCVRLWLLWGKFRGLRVLKRWGGRYGLWVGCGWQVERTKLVEQCWLKTMSPPYIEGTGINFTVLRLSFRIGPYVRISNVGMPGEETTYESVNEEIRLSGFTERTIRRRRPDEVEA